MQFFLETFAIDAVLESDASAHALATHQDVTEQLQTMVTGQPVPQRFLIPYP